MTLLKFSGTVSFFNFKSEMIHSVPRIVALIAASENMGALAHTLVFIQLKLLFNVHALIFF